MSKSYKVAKKTINMGEKKGQTLFSVRPYSYGTLTTEEVANQIAVESTATPADVKAVLDRLGPVTTVLNNPSPPNTAFLIPGTV